MEEKERDSREVFDNVTLYLLNNFYHIQTIELKSANFEYTS
jgi:hypothetical protein